MKTIKVLTVSLLTIFLFSGFFNDDSVKEQKQAIQEEKKATLELLYKKAPASKKLLQDAYGYAAFSNIGINLLLLSTENGNGVAHNNKTGKETYMKMWSGGVGVGLGVKDFRAVFIFKTKKAFDSFVNSGWEANAQADAAAKSDKKGGAYGGAVTVAEDILLYKLTKNGLALQASIQGTKYWQNDDLNK